MNSKLTGLLGMAKRAGQVQVGFNETVSAAKAGKSCLTVLAADLSEKTEKEWQFATKQQHPETIRIPLNKAELAHALGLSRDTGLVAICDRGFAQAILAQCPEHKED